MDELEKRLKAEGASITYRQFAKTHHRFTHFGAVEVAREALLRTCRDLGFTICVSCDREHAYCSAPCRVDGRRASALAARQRHQASPEGRLDHRDASALTANLI
jgi:hypothetical protein